MAIEDVSLFSIPIRIVDLENHDEIQAAFSAWIKPDHPNLRRVRAWECNTKTTFGQDSALFPFDVLRSSLEPQLHDYVTTHFRPQGETQVVEKEIWLNVYSKGDYQEIHNHLGALTIVSMAYMLELPARSGSFVFSLSGDTFFRSLTDFVRPDFSRERYVPNLQEGQAVLFPSFLPHYVTPHASNQLRATISANYNVSHPSLSSP